MNKLNIVLAMIMVSSNLLALEDCFQITNKSDIPVNAAVTFSYMGKKIDLTFDKNKANKKQICGVVGLDSVELQVNKLDIKIGLKPISIPVAWLKGGGIDIYATKVSSSPYNKPISKHEISDEVRSALHLPALPASPTLGDIIGGTDFASSNKNYKRLAAKWHPDKNSDPAANEVSQLINEAWAQLKDQLGENQEYNEYCISFTPSPQAHANLIKILPSLDLYINSKDKVLQSADTGEYAKKCGDLRRQLNRKIR